MAGGVTVWLAGGSGLPPGEHAASGRPTAAGQATMTLALFNTPAPICSQTWARASFGLGAERYLA